MAYAHTSDDFDVDAHVLEFFRTNSSVFTILRFVMAVALIAANLL